MTRLSAVLAAYVVMSGSHTYREVFIQAIDKTGAARIECGNSREVCSDLAMLLNEARERREGLRNHDFGVLLKKDCNTCFRLGDGSGPLVCTAVYCGDTLELKPK
jgi:hypothetical protein